MAHHKSAKKRIITSEKARLRNRRYRTVMRKALRAFREATTKEEAQSLLNETSALLEKMASKGIIHKNKAARTKSRMYKRVAGLK
jgi:small subunit ribosomal protein S20